MLYKPVIAGDLVTILAD